MSGRISLGPRAQFMPTLNSGTWEIEFQNASTVWPVTPRLLPGCMKVTEAINGTRLFVSSKSLAIAKNAALALSVSKMVSTNSRSTPPSSKPRACS